VDEGKLREFAANDVEIRDLEAKVDFLKHRQSKLSADLLEQMGLEAKTQALVEVFGNKMYKIYVRRQSHLRVTSPMVAEASLRALGLKDFLDFKVDAARLGSWYKKREKEEKSLPEIPGLEYTDSYRLYCIEKRQ